jgi:hypothetical protein
MTCKHVTGYAGPVAPNGDIYISCAKCGEDMNNTGLKRPSDQIRERAEEIKRDKDTQWEFRRSEPAYLPDLWARVEAIEEHLDRLAGFPTDNQ